MGLDSPGQNEPLGAFATSTEVHSTRNVLFYKIENNLLDPRRFHSIRRNNFQTGSGTSRLYIAMVIAKCIVAIHRYGQGDSKPSVAA